MVIRCKWNGQFSVVGYWNRKSVRNRCGWRSFALNLSIFFSFGWTKINTFVSSIVVEHTKWKHVDLFPSKMLENNKASQNVWSNLSLECKLRWGNRTMKANGEHFYLVLTFIVEFKQRKNLLFTGIHFVVYSRFVTEWKKLGNMSLPNVVSSIVCQIKFVSSSSNKIWQY